jgi:putative nucleotidyltransferase with HDIG domain
MKREKRSGEINMNVPQIYEHIFVLVLIVLIIVLIFLNKSKKYNSKNREYRTIISQVLCAISNAIDAKDSYTSGHSVRVAAYSAEIARRLGMKQEFIENIYFIGLLHDVGKIGTPNEILNKQDKLTDEEYEIMKKHSYLSGEILENMSTIHNLAAGVAEHHERWDGKGYYQKIEGENISLEARIIALADTYDAMSSNRSYRKALPREVILEEFKKCNGKQFDPKISEIVIEMIEHDQFINIDVDKLIDLKRVHIYNKKGIHDGFDYELYRTAGNTVLTFTGGGTFRCIWKDVDNAIFRMGKRFDEVKTYPELGEIQIKYDAGFYPKRCSNLVVYGWFVDPFVEYWIVENWWGREVGTFLDFIDKNIKGTVTVDGDTYNIYEFLITGKTPNKETQAYKQYWSVRTNKRAEGIVSVNEHFKAWEYLGMRFGKVLEVSLAIFGWQSSGAAEVRRNMLTIGETTIGTPR